MKFVLIIGDWIKNHIIVSIIGIIVVGGAVTTSIILLNQDNDLKPNENIKEEVKQDNQEQEPEEPELNEDGCPVGSFLNYYGICQDEHLYEPQECPEGEMWWPNNLAEYATIDNGDGTVSTDWEAAFGIDGLPTGACTRTYEAQDAWYRSHGYPGMNPDDKKYYDHANDCERGFSYDFETGTCKDETARYRSMYEKYVLNKSI